MVTTRPLDHALPAVLALVPPDAVPLAKEGLRVDTELVSDPVGFLWGLRQVEEHLGDRIFERLRTEEKRCRRGYLVGRGGSRGNLQRGHCGRELRGLLRDIVLLLAWQRAVKTFEVAAV